MTGDETLRRAEEAELAARRDRQDAGDEIVSPLADADERAIETALRPKRLTEFVGQARVREQLSLILQSALRRGRPPDHVLLAGPPGLGKTTIAMIVAAELGAPLRITSGPAIERSGDLADELGEPLGPQRGLDGPLVRVGQRGHDLVPGVLAGPARGQLGLLGPAEGLVPGHRATACSACAGRRAVPWPRPPRRRRGRRPRPRPPGPRWPGRRPWPASPG